MRLWGQLCLIFSSLLEGRIVRAATKSLLKSIKGIRKFFQDDWKICGVTCPHNDVKCFESSNREKDILNQGGF